MRELTKAKRRIKQLERCLDSVREILAWELEVRFRYTVRDDEEAKFIDKALRRINRTLR